MTHWMGRLGEEARLFGESDRTPVDALWRRRHYSSWALDLTGLCTVDIVLLGLCCTHVIICDVISS
jgi:hypothetical protein